MYALTITGTLPEDRTATLTDALREPRTGPGAETLRTRPGQLHAVYSEPEPALDAGLAAVRLAADAPVGIGLGAGDLAPPETDGEPWTGPALDWSRAAAENAPGPRTAPRLAVDGRDPALADVVTALTRLLARGVRERTDAEWRVVDLLVPGVRGQHATVATTLGITPQAVSKALLRTGWQEELDGRAAAAELLRRLDRA